MYGTPISPEEGLQRDRSSSPSDPTLLRPPLNVHTILHLQHFGSQRGAWAYVFASLKCFFTLRAVLGDLQACWELGSRLVPGVWPAKTGRAGPCSVPDQQTLGRAGLTRRYIHLPMIISPRLDFLQQRESKLLSAP